MDPAHLNKLFSISNWLFLMPCYYQNSIGDLWNTLCSNKTLSLSWKSRIDSYFPRPVGSPASPPAWERGVVLPFVTWAGTCQTCSWTFVHASSWPNTAFVMVKQNFSLFLTPRHGGVASVASQKSVPVPSRKNLCPCNAAGRLAFAYLQCG